MLNLAQIAIGCALGYLDFRYDERNWRGDYPALAAWFEKVAKRPSFVETAPE